jgi:DNA polymerase-1
MTNVAMEVPTLTSRADTDFDRMMGMLEALYLRDGDETKIAVDTETNAEDVRDGRGYCQGISFAFRLLSQPTSFYIPLRHIDSENNLSRDRLAKLCDFLESFQGWLIFHNAKFDLVSLSTAGINYGGRFYCTMLMCHHINENFPMDKSLDTCVKYYVKNGESKKNSVIFNLLVKHLGWANIRSDDMREYAEGDAYITFLLFEKIIKQFQLEVPEKYWQHRQDFHRVVIAMERRGIHIDQDVCVSQSQIGIDRMTTLRRELKINPGSSNGLKQLLIDQLGLPVVKITDAGRKLQKDGKQIDEYKYASFDKEAMGLYDEILERDDSPVAQQVLEFRGWQKTVSSNYKAYLRLRSPDGKLRPNYKLHGTKTGRLSCSDPNLQQIPRESEKEWNGKLKQAFLPTEGYELWEFDYSQLELRLATAYAKEETLKLVFAQDRDIFTEMSKTLGFSRQDTKTFVYSVQYGAGLDRLMHVFRVSKARAQDMRENYKQSYPGFVKVESIAKMRCRTKGKVQLWSGRYRHFFNRENDAHKAFNSAIQGGAADIVEHVMVRLFKEIDNEQECRMLLTVHDSIIFEIRKDLVEDYKSAIMEIMADVQPDFGVKFAVEGKVFGLVT